MGKITDKSKRTRKNMVIDAEKLAAAKRLLGVRTETEAVDLALNRLLFGEKIEAVLERGAKLTGWVAWREDESTPEVKSAKRRKSA